MSKLRRWALGAATMFSATIVALVPVASAANTTLVVTPTNNQGWSFNPDPNTQTPYEFTEEEASTGDGSLYVKPIGANPADKFIAAKTLSALTSDVSSVAYDFQIAGDGTAADAKHFYLNVYTNLPGSNTFYDCRFDYVPTTGSTSNFTTANTTANTVATNVGDRGGDGFTCPDTWGEMPAGSTVSFIALNVGDTSANDVGLAGYLDNVVLQAGGNSVTYNFEVQEKVKLTNKEQCKNGGWMTSTDPVYRNQGECVSSFASKKKAAQYHNN